MVDLERRLSEHGDLLERDYPTISLTELSDRLDVVAAIPIPAPPVRPIQPRPRPLTAAPRRRSLRVALAAAMVGLIIAGVAWLARGTPDGEVIDQPTVTSIPTPTTAPLLSSLAWSRVPSDEAVFGGKETQWMEGVTVGGPGLVAVGSDGSSAAVWTSADGTTWDRVPHDEAVFGGSGQTSMLSVTVGGPGLVAVGWEGFLFSTRAQAAVWTSIDGVSWSRVPHDEAVFGGMYDQWMKSVTAGGPGLVAVGADGGSGAAVWTSVDGLTWSRVAQDTSIFGFPGGQGFGMVSVTVGGPGLVAVGYLLDVGDVGGPAVWTSVDGITWSRVPDETEPDGFMWGVTAGGPGLVAVGLDGSDDSAAAVWTSVDGISWSRVPHDEAVFGGQGGLLMSMNSVTTTGQGLVAVGFGGRFGDSGRGSGPGGSNRQQPGAGPLSSASAAVWTSLDGVTWSRVPHDDAVFGEADGRWTGITSVINFGPGVVAVGADRSSGDVDAAVWVAATED